MRVKGWVGMARHWDEGAVHDSGVGEGLIVVIMV